MVYIPRALIDEMVRHALAERPNEACGMVAGIRNRATKVYPATNADPSPVRYLMEPRDQLRIMRDIEERGWELLGIFHSHTHTAAYPSQTDVSLAYYPDALYIIISLADENHPVVRAFHIVDGQITEEPIEEPPDN
ncbi:MAG TPA: M67 family metallopeptidase [Chloroflexota bacterium]|nr:M67 family metallopeptidase [Chloroflexota bacterium]